MALACERHPGAPCGDSIASEKAGVTGQIMSAKVYTATVATLFGMVTQPDLINALYRRVALAA